MSHSKILKGHLAILRRSEHHATWRDNRDNSQYFIWATDFKIRVTQAISDWLPKVGYAAGLLLESLNKKTAQWWYFLEDPLVPSDNNRAERNLRLAVTKPKVCGDSSFWGSAFY
ncbi:MAG: hypothetical protein AUK48_08915 [Oscillatoriales cyanobacterium CG2_30_44_21]|nr:MAG: hypothetical protein AUK48_08915 [Oscillatoriales cyanobacterium CG2_30_44_21]